MAITFVARPCVARSWDLPGPLGGGAESEPATFGYERDVQAERYRASDHRGTRGNTGPRRRGCTRDRPPYHPRTEQLAPGELGGAASRPYPALEGTRTVRFAVRSVTGSAIKRRRADRRVGARRAKWARSPTAVGRDCAQKDRWQKWRPDRRIRGAARASRSVPERGPGDDCPRMGLVPNVPLADTELQHRTTSTRPDG